MGSVRQAFTRGDDAPGIVVTTIRPCVVWNLR